MIFQKYKSPNDTLPTFQLDPTIQPLTNWIDVSETANDPHYPFFPLAFINGNLEFFLYI